jgi:hypothetical protein
MAKAKKPDGYTQEQRRLYNRLYKELKSTRNLAIMNYRPPIAPLPILPLDGGLGYCSAFGCGKKLTRTESLCGDKCISCQNKFVRTISSSR